MRDPGNEVPLQRDRLHFYFVDRINLWKSGWGGSLNFFCSNRSHGKQPLTAKKKLLREIRVGLINPNTLNIVRLKTGV